MLSSGLNDRLGDFFNQEYFLFLGKVVSIPGGLGPTNQDIEVLPLATSNSLRSNVDNFNLRDGQKIVRYYLVNPYCTSGHMEIARTEMEGERTFFISSSCPVFNRELPNWPFLGDPSLNIFRARWRVLSTIYTKYRVFDKNLLTVLWTK